VEADRGEIPIEDPQFVASALLYEAKGQSA
jgi:hypothetical protein